MKNFFIIFSCFFISYSVAAQNFGLKVGNTASWMDGSYETSDYFNTNTFLGGAFVQFGDGNIFLRNEINYLQKGNLEKLLVTDLKQTLSYFETNALSYFQIRDFISIHCGGFLGYLQNAKSISTINDNNSSQDIDLSNYNRFDYGINLGATIHLAQFFELEVRYGHGLNNVYSSNNYEAQNRHLQITAGLRF